MIWLLLLVALICMLTLGRGLVRNQFTRLSDCCGATEVQTCVAVRLDKRLLRRSGRLARNALPERTPLPFPDALSMAYSIATSLLQSLRSVITFHPVRRIVGPRVA